MVSQAKALHASVGCQAVLIKGGHGTSDAAVDVLVSATGVDRFVSPRVSTRHSHGTGCTLSAAIAALLAQGAPLKEAVERAKAFVWEGLRHGRTLGVGHGAGPVDHLFAVRRANPPA